MQTICRLFLAALAEDFELARAVTGASMAPMGRPSTKLELVKTLIAARTVYTNFQLTLNLVQKHPRSAICAPYFLQLRQMQSCHVINMIRWN